MSKPIFQLLSCFFIGSLRIINHVLELFNYLCSYAFQMVTEEVTFFLWADWSRVNKRIECCFPKKELYLVFSSPLKTSGFACGKCCSCVTLAKASVICCVLFGEVMTYKRADLRQLRLRWDIGWRISRRAPSGESLVWLIIQWGTGWHSWLKRSVHSVSCV